MEVEIAEMLSSEKGRAAISAACKMLDEKTPPVSALSKLRKSFTSEEAAAVWTAAQSRRRAAKKIGGDSEVLLLDREGYEMASGAVAAAYHAKLLLRCGTKRVLDLCAGLGLDSIAFARAGMNVTAYEKDEGRARLLRENVEQLGFKSKIMVVNADVTEIDMSPADAVFFDPARRSSERRWSKSGNDTEPPLSFIDTLLRSDYSTVLAKLSPAVERTVAEQYCGELQFVSKDRECKESLLFLHAEAVHGKISAVLLPTEEAFDLTDSQQLRPHFGNYLWEPDPAVARSGLTGALAKSLGGWQGDPHNDYFFTDSFRETPFAECYAVRAAFPYSKRKLQEQLAGTGRLILKQRNFPQSIDEVRGQVKLGGKAETTVVLAGFNQEKFAFIVERIRPGSENATVE